MVSALRPTCTPWHTVTPDNHYILYLQAGCGLYLQAVQPCAETTTWACTLSTISATAKLTRV
jgi:hypothetical protein